MKYRNPNNVSSPKDLVKDVRVLADNGVESYSIAKLKWNNKECHAIRWNISQREWDNNQKIKNDVECIGMPSSRGHSTWFILPAEFDKYIPEILKETKK